MFQPTALETTRVAVEMAKRSEAYCRETIASFFQDAAILKLTDE